MRDFGFYGSQWSIEKGTEHIIKPLINIKIDQRNFHNKQDIFEKLMLSRHAGF